MRWSGYGIEPMDPSAACRPLDEVEAVLQDIRFPLMSDEELAAVAGHPMRDRSAALRELISEALEARAEEGAGPVGGSAGPARAIDGVGGGQLLRGVTSMRADRELRALTPAQAAAAARFHRRHPPGCRELLYMYDGDHNGVCRHLGTVGGTQQWVNPVASGRLRVWASSPNCRGTDPRALVGGNFSRVNFAGPRREGPGSQLSAWWALDLGPGTRLVCNYYTLRADGSADFLRSWVLQGSGDGSIWVDLSRHLNDRTIKLPGQYASWPVVGHTATLPYRFFRILLVGPNPEAPNAYHVALSYLELYGWLYPGLEDSAAETVAAENIQGTNT
jgi:hypothetical protein